MSAQAIPRRRRRPTRLLTVPRWWLGAALLVGPLGWGLAFGAGWATARTAPSSPPAGRSASASPAPLGASSAVSPEPRDGGPRLGRSPPSLAVDDVGETVGALETASASASGEADAPASPAAAEPSPPPHLRRAPAGRFGVQVAAYPTIEEAEAFLVEHRAALEAAGPVHVIQREVKGDTWFRIRLGSHPGAAAAEAARAALPRELGAGAMVVRYR